MKIMQAPKFEAFNSSEENLDGFDFNLEAEDDMLADSKTSNVSMDFQFESMKEELTNSLNDLKFDDCLEEEDEDAEPVRRPPTDARAARSRRSLLSKSKTFAINPVNFDPPANNDRTDDSSVNTYATAPTTHQASQSSTSLSSMAQSSVFTLDNYNGALEHLAQTMKRTEESRRQVMLQRAIMTQAEEQRRLRAEEQAALHAQQAMAYRNNMRSNQFQGSFDTMNNGGGSSSEAAAFLTGSSGTLTSGLAHSRRQLQIYMAQMNGQTF
jgi:hypothetical protein